MNIQQYKEQQQHRLEQETRYRQLCAVCVQPEFGCYCQHIHSFDPKIKFSILIHPIEVKRRIATGRMSHLCLQNSELISGQEYSGNLRVNQLIADPHFHSVILYPGRTSKNLTSMTLPERGALFPPDKNLNIFVIDGTWATARKMLNRSPNLQTLPRVCFSPPSVSNFRVRKQPSPECYSTIEAIHHTIELLGAARGFDTSSRQHDRLLYVFDQMVETQLKMIRHAELNPRADRYRREKKPA